MSAPFAPLTLHLQPSTASTDQESDAYATNATLSGHVPPAGAPKPDSVEGKPGIIETAEIAPLGEGKVVDDRESGPTEVVEHKNAIMIVKGCEEGNLADPVQRVCSIRLRLSQRTLRRLSLALRRSKSSNRL